MSTYASASKASAGIKSRSEYSGAAIGGALIFGAVVGMAGVHISSSPLLTGASTDLGLTSTRSTSKNVDFDTDAFHFNHCLEGDYTPPDPAFASWSSDGSSARKLDTMKREVLLDPIGVYTDESDASVKYYNKPYFFKDANGDGAPLAETRATIETMKQEALTTCVNPLPGIEADGLLAETSKACSSEISAAAAKVYEDYKACKKIVDGLDGKLDDYSTWSGVEYALQTERDDLLKLYNDRKAAGEKYDKDFEKWLAAHNDALASCAYASNYQTLSANVDANFIQLLQTEKSTIGTHCENIPSMNQFQVKNIGVTARRALLQSDSSKTCESILEAMQGVSDSEKFEHDGRANCLEFYCESAAVTKDPAARGVAEASLAAYDLLDAQFAAALEAFNKNHETYTAFNAAIEKNSALVIQARDEVVGQQNVTDTSKAKLLKYLACPASSICCQAPEDIPAICAQDAAGEVATYAAPAEFTLQSPPPAKEFTPSKSQKA